MVVVVVALVVVVLAAGCGGEAKLEMGKARSEIARSLERTYELDVDDVR